ncbi:hypothetical protein KO528_17355 [Saccharophagus degradans]|uniref:hypothetical protein n=1 Tax=Saccharophagus degradans TaxID=86304 RepID=UPI001C096F05|nr:hypothetical protein [Saccharophagus degradans]MBU2987137.1 hypothetical protein [Saccharophagus degradans]
MNLPDYNNVYGSFDASADLEKLATYIRREHSNSLLEIKVDKSRDGAKTISIKGSSIELRSRKLENGKYSLSGAVAGELESVLLALEELRVIFKRHQLSIEFEVYNSNYECIGKLNA